MSKIEWTQKTWNPTTGCSKVSAGCKNCYAIRMSNRNQHNPASAAKYAGTTCKTAGGALNFTGKINLHEEVLQEPLKRKKPTTYFVNSMSDLFHENVPFEFIDKVFAVMALCPQHTFQVLTKRPERMLEYTTAARCANRILEQMQVVAPDQGIWVWNGWNEQFKNVWFGTSVENQEAADTRIPLLLQVPATVRFLSCEPLLEPVEFSNVTKRSDAVSQLGKAALSGIHWVIAGGESGPGARPMHPGWVRSLRDQCAAAGAAFFFKQWGEFLHPSQATDERQCERAKGEYLKPGKKLSGNLLDGKQHQEYPASQAA